MFISDVGSEGEDDVVLRLDDFDDHARLTLFDHTGRVSIALEPDALREVVEWLAEFRAEQQGGGQ